MFNNIHLVQSDTSKDITQKVNEGLFPTWTVVLATILAVLILMLVLTKLLYKPVKKNFKDRQDYIQNNIDEATKQNDEASSDRVKANEELMIARSEAADILTAAKVRSEQVRAEKLEAARLEAQQLVKTAKLDIEQEKSKFEEEAKKEMVEIALKAASKVVEKEVDNKTNRKIVEDYIKAN